MIGTIPTREYRHRVTGAPVYVGCLNLADLKAPSGDTTHTLTAETLQWNNTEARELVLQTVGGDGSRSLSAHNARLLAAELLKGADWLDEHH